MASPEELAELINNKDVRRMLIQILFSIAFRFTHRKEIAEDIIQETFEALLKIKEESLDKIEDLHAYAKKITANKAKKWFEQEKGKNGHIEPHHNEPVTTTDPLTKEEIKEIIYYINASRQEPDLTIFKMLCDGSSYTEIAAKTGQTEAYVRRRVYEMRKQIRGRFKHE